MFTVLEFSDFSVIALIVILFAGGGAACTFLRAPDASRLARLERKLDALLGHLNVVYVDPASPERLSEEVRRIANDPARKIEAIKLHREQTGLGLKDAKDAVEAYMSGRT
jgi:hypothetical protein